MKITVCFLGQPQVFLDGKEIQIPQKKQFAFLLYMLYYGRCSRSSLVSVFWDRLEDDSARQNLRNMLYRLKRFLGENFFSTDGRMISISPAFEVIRDTDAVTMADAGSCLMQLPSSMFMDHFYLHDTPGFEKWVVSMQAAHEKIIVERLESCMRESVHMIGRDCEVYAKKLLTISPYHEEAVRVLLRRYAGNGMYSEAIDTYARFVERLKKDLLIEPEKATQQEYQMLLELREAHSLSFQSRVATQRHRQILDELSKEHTRFSERKNYRHCVLCGPMGAGKSIILESFCRQVAVNQLLRVRFEASNAGIPFYAIGKLLSLLSDRYHLRIDESFYCDSDTLMLHYITSIGRIANQLQEKDIYPLLAIENMEAIDQHSMDIILTHLLDRCWGRVAVVGEYCTSLNANPQTILHMELMDHVLLLPVQLLSEQEMVSYLSRQLSPLQEQLPEFGEIWTWTGGNLMLLDDVVEHIRAGDDGWKKSNAAAVRCTRVLLSSLSEEERRFLEMLSIFHQGVEMRVLASLLEISSVQVADVAERMYQRELLKEEDFDSVLLVRMAPHMICSTIYEQMPRLRRIELHRAAAEYYRTRTASGQLRYHQIRELKYHYEMAGWSYEQVYYALECFRYQLDYCDDFFPTIRSDPKILDTIYLSKPEIYHSFDQLETMIGRLSDQLSPEQMSNLGMMFEYLKGRTLIRDSRSAEGLQYIRRVISDAEQLGREDLLLHSYLEIVFSGLRAENIGMMSEYIRMARTLPNFSQYEKEQGILLRLEAMCEIMEQRYDRAEELLCRSISIMEGPKLRNSSAVHVAAAYDYLALINRRRGAYDSAVQQLWKAIGLCEQNGVRKRLDLFYTDLGYTYFLQGDLSAAKDSFTKGAEIYSQFDSCWLRSICESCMAMIYAKDGCREKALESYRRAEIYFKKDHTCKEEQVLLQAKEELLHHHIL